MTVTLAKLSQHTATLSAAALKRVTHLLVVLPKSEKPDAGTPYAPVLRAVLARRKKKLAELAKSPLSADTSNSALVAWVMIDAGQSTFEKQTAMRKALALLLTEHPPQIDIAISGDAATREANAALAMYTAWVNGWTLDRKSTRLNSSHSQQSRMPSSA